MVGSGTPSFGKHNKRTHARCRRCGRHAYHMQHAKCAACGYPDARLRIFRWQWKNPLSRKRKK